MRKLISSIAIVVFLSLNSYADWQPLDGSINAPWYGAANYFSTVEWNGQRWVFAADAIGSFYRSSDNGTTWRHQDNPPLLDRVCAILVDPFPGREGYVYVARYEPGDPRGINGFWRSTDGGITFTQQNGDICNNPPSGLPLGNKMIMSIRKIWLGESTALVNQFPDVIVTCNENAGDPGDDGKKFYVSNPTEQVMCWKQLFVPGASDEFPAYLDPGTNIRYGVSDFAQNIYYDAPGFEPDSIELIVGLTSYSEPRPYPQYFGNWRKDSRIRPPYYPVWEYIQGIPQGGYRVWAGTAFFRYKNSDVTTWPIYSFSSWRDDTYLGNPRIIPEIYKYHRDQSPLEWDLLNNPSIFPGASASIFGSTMYNFWDLAIAGSTPQENYMFMTCWKQYDRDPAIPSVYPGIYVSTNEGATWSENKAISDRGIYFPMGRGVISYPASPGGPLLTFMGTTQPPLPGIIIDMPFYGAVYKSTDNGESWVEATKHMNTLMSHEIEISHDSMVACGPTVAVVDSEAFFTFSTDLGANWAARYSRQIFGASPIGHIRTLKQLDSDHRVLAAIIPVDGPTLQCDSILVSTNWGKTWAAEYGFDRAAGNMIYSMASYSNRFYATVDGDNYVLRRIPNAVGAWEKHGDWNFTGWGGPRGIDVGPYGAGDHIAYAGSASDGVKKLIGDGTTWQSTALGSGYSNVDLVKIIPSANSATVFVKATYGNNKRLFRTIDGGNLWQSSDEGIPQEYRNIQAIEPMPGHPSVILATGVNSSFQGRAFLSLDMGKTWMEFDGGDLLPNVYMKDIAFYMGNPPYTYGRMAYVATNGGLYRQEIPIPTPTAITSDTIWTADNPIFVLGDLTIASGATLTIQPGTKIYFAPNSDLAASGTDPNRCEIIVQGNLVANASGGLPISFTPWTAFTSADTAEWYGIIGGLGGLGGSSITMVNCIVERAIFGVKGNSSNLNIRHCAFSYIADSGIYSPITPNGAVIDSNTFEKCYDWAIDVNQGNNHDFIGNRIADCNKGMRYSTSAGSSIALDYRYNNLSNSFFTNAGDGIHIEALLPIAANVQDNTISGYGNGIYLSKVGTGAITGNYSHNNGGYGLYLINVGASLVCGSTNYNSFRYNKTGISCNGTTNSTFRYNKSKDNTSYGVYIALSSTPNFGAGASVGNNSIVNPTGLYDVYRDGVTSPTVMAEGCYWGGGTGRIFGNVDNNPYLIADPLPGNPRLDPGSSPNLPENHIIASNYPNPFNPQTTISFSLSKGDYLTLEVFNIIGQKVKTLGSAYFAGGSHKIVWDGTNENGEPQASGIYFCKISGQETSGSAKMTLLR